MSTIIKEIQDLTYLRWSHIRSSSGTAGTFLKSSSSLGEEKKYYKLSNFDPVEGVIGHECINEIIVDRLLTIFGIEHLDYSLLNANISIEGRIYNTYLCSSKDFKARSESKVALDDYYRINALQGESHYDFCKRMGWQEYIDKMIVIDYLILNRDRHGANIEVLRNARVKTLQLAPLFDHGVSLLYSCRSDDEAQDFDILSDKQCNNFIGSHSCYENLKLIARRKRPIKRKLKPSDKDIIFKDLNGILSQVFIDRIWEMIWERYCIYENL